MLNFSKIIVSYFILICVLFFGGLLFSQEKAAYDYKIPEEIDLTKWSHLSSEKGEISYLSDKFYPIGWSATGNYFAWATEIEPEDAEPPEGYDFLIFVQDVKTDKIVWKWSVKETNFKDYNYKQKVYIRKIWGKYKQIFSSGLNDYGIVPLTINNLFLKMPVTVNQVTFSAKINKQFRKNTYFSGNLNELSQENIVIKAEGLGSKTIYKKTYENAGIRDSFIIGLILSPFSRKAMLVKVNENWGWEKSPYVLTVELIGSDLTDGFKK